MCANDSLSIVSPKWSGRAKSLMNDKSRLPTTGLQPEFRVRISNPIITPSPEIPSADQDQLFDMVEEMLSEALELDPEREPLPVKLPNRSPNPRAGTPALAQRVVDLRPKVMCARKQVKLLTQELGKKDRLLEDRPSLRRHRPVIQTGRIYRSPAISFRNCSDYHRPIQMDGIFLTPLLT
jgi:hypothetical protein